MADNTDEAAFDIDPRLQLAIVSKQRNEALDQAAAWESVARSERSKYNAMVQAMKAMSGTAEVIEPEPQPALDGA